MALQIRLNHADNEDKHFMIWHKRMFVDELTFETKQAIIDNNKNYPALLGI